MTTAAMHSYTIGDYTVHASADAFPAGNDVARTARLHDDLSDLSLPGATHHWLALSHAGRGVLISLLLTVERNAHPGHLATLLLPETSRLFVGLQDRLLCYDLTVPARLWAAPTFWFHKWVRYRDFVLMVAEYELAAWTTSGSRLWSWQADWPYTLEFDGEWLTIPDPGSGAYVPAGRFPLWKGPSE